MNLVREHITLNIKKKWCKGCGICVNYCPKTILVLDENAKIKVHSKEKCIKCGQCELRCPDFAIFLDGGGINE